MGDDIGACMSENGGINDLKIMTRKDVSVRKKTDVVRDALCVVDVVRPSSETYSRVPYRDRVGGGGETVPVVPNGDRPVGGDERNHPHISKQNPVTGGLRGRVHFWEMKSEQRLNENQSGIATESNTHFNTEGKLGAGYRKKKTY